MTRFEAMCAHPAGKGIPESAEVRWERETAQALELANRRLELEDAKATLRSYGWIERVVAHAAAIIGLFVVVCGFAFLGDPGAGWPA